MPLYICLSDQARSLRHLLIKLIKNDQIRECTKVVKFTGNTRHCTMPVLSYEMAVPFMFNFIKIKLQEVGKHKPDTFHEQVIP